MTKVMFFLIRISLNLQYRSSDTRLCLIATGNQVTVQGVDPKGKPAYRCDSRGRRKPAPLFNYNIMQAILTPRQTEVVLKSIGKLLTLYNMDQRKKLYPKDCNDFLSWFTKDDFRLLKSLVDIFEQSQGVTFCSQVK